jgi:hypothetical protein
MFSAFLLAAPVISFLDIDGPVSKMSLFEEESKSESNTEFQLNLEFISRTPYTSPLDLMVKTNLIFEDQKNETCNVYLNPTVPPPRIS